MESVNTIIKKQGYVKEVFNVDWSISEIREDDRITGIVEVVGRCDEDTIIRIAKTSTGNDGWSWIGTLGELFPLVCKSKGIKLY